jgi:acyl-CoA reductase-like NAD-dependent aldehyde dehydrogenase
MLGNLIN